jgi:hypothetical protein
MLRERILIDRLRKVGFDSNSPEVSYVIVLKWLAVEKGVLVRIHGHWDFERELPIYKVGFTVKRGDAAEDINVEYSFLNFDDAGCGVIREILSYLEGGYDE